MTAADTAVPGALSAVPSADQLEINKIVVLGLPWQTEESTLHQHFSQYGPIEDFQIMRERYTGKSRGFGFVTFSSPVDAQKAVAAPEHLIDGRRCEAKFALPEGKVGTSRATRIFIARIPTSVTDAEFKSYFEQFGHIQDAYMPKDPSKKGHRGIGFVTYSSPEAVEMVLSKTHVLNGNEVAIDTAAPKDKGDGSSLSLALPGRLPVSQPNLHLMGGGMGVYAYHRQQQQLHHDFHHSYPLYPYQDGPTYAGEATALEGGAPSGVRRRRHHHHQHQDALGIRHMSYPMMGSMTHAAMQHPAGMHGVYPQPIGAVGGGDTGTVPVAGALPMPSSVASITGSSAADAEPSSRAPLSSQMQGPHVGSPSSQHLLNMLQAKVAAAAAVTAAGGLASDESSARSSAQSSINASPHSSKRTESNDPSSSGDLAGLLAHHEQMAVAAAWQAGAPRPAINHAALSRQLNNAAAGGSLPMLSHHQQQQQQQQQQGHHKPQQLGPPSARAGPRIFVGKLNRDTSEQDVKDYFSHFGFVLDVYLPRDKTNRKDHRGFGFITFETDASVQRVVSHGVHYIRGSLVAIDSAVPRLEELDGSGSGNCQSDAEAVQQALEALRLEKKGM